MAQISKCKSCGAAIRWKKTMTGKMMPVDYEQIAFYPDSEGKELFVTDGGSVVHGVRAPEEANIVHFGYISHFATCPNADQHRRKA